VWDSANPRWLYVAVEDTDGVAIIDRTAGVLTTTAGVGRLPSGVAVSRLRRELYVTHRIDGKVTIVPLTDDADAGAEDAGEAGLDDTGEGGVEPVLSSPVDVPLGYEVGDGTQTTPHGTPYGFESLAWYPDGNIAWVPHELVASTHPFQFQTTVFPAVSVVDLSQRAEVQTNPNDPNGVVAGRKNLFAAIDLFDAADSPIVVSQPCGVAFHPNGLAAYAIACGSEDLLTFDCTQGIAVDVLRNIPGDHPVGIALDTAGARAFVLEDESQDPAAPAPPLHSKSLHVYDTAGGSVVGHVSIIGTPITLVAADPVAPSLRAGLRYFFRANAQKGEYATTGNDWMSCGACHLDGFVSSNNVLLSIMSQGIDTFVDARIGHSGLVDFFSTSAPANAPNDPPFNPHDILSAFTEMGGLSPDRTGATRTGAVSPSSPPSDAVTLASQVATVIARDLPLGPTWLLPGATKPNPSYDGAWCGQCHAAQYAAWQKSAHAHAAVDPMVLFCSGIEQQNNGVQYSRLCAGCHDPVSSRLGDTSLTSGRGITCLGCHDAARTIRAGGNEDLQVATNDWTVDHAARAAASLPLLRDPRFCGTCHEQFVPGDGMRAIGTLAEYQASVYAGSTDVQVANPIIDDGGAAPPVAVIEDGGGSFVARCVDCHAPVYQGVADHSMVGGNVYLATEVTNDSTMAANEVANLQSALTLAASRVGDVVYLTITNRGAGHSFPTGVTDIREPWVELQAVDASKNVVAVYGGPAPDGTIPLDDVRLGIDIAGEDGGLLLEHQLSKAVGIPFNRVVPPHGSVQVTLAAPTSLPAPAVELDAVVEYRNVRTTYLRLATDSGTATAPTTELARVAVP
jgi:DNA-binding beta-propeller fold protein YncE